MLAYSYLTKTATYVAAVGAIVTGSESVFSQAFPKSIHPTAGDKVALLIAIIAAWALIVVADILSRGYAHAHHASRITTAPAGMTATITNGPDDTGWTVAAIRFSPGASPKASFLLTKAGQEPQWKSGKDIQFQADPTEPTKSSR